jgi:hypothetical protein
MSAKPSVNVFLRLSPDIHAMMSVHAKLAKTSVNAWVAGVLREKMSTPAAKKAFLQAVNQPTPFIQGFIDEETRAGHALCREETRRRKA